MADGTGPLYWNPGAISYLVELLLAAMLSVYFAKRLWDEHRRGGIFTPTLLLGVTIWFMVPGLFVSLLHALAGGGWTSYVMPWLSPVSAVTLAMPWVATFTGISAVAFVQFAYRFPRRLAGSARESLIVGMAMGLCVMVEVAIAVATDLAMLDNDGWSRPDWLAGWTNASMIWAATLFLRHFVDAQGGWAKVRTLPKQVFGRPINREATAARGFIIFTLLPIIHTIALVLQQDGTLGGFSMDFLISWSVLGQLTGLTLVYFGYLPERSSFLFKLTAISVLLLLASINGACWIISRGYAAQFRVSPMVAAGQALRFSPGAGGYALTGTPFAPDDAAGAGAATGTGDGRVALPFAFPFYGKSYRLIHVGSDGTIGFDRPPRPADALIRYGVQPAIYPLLTGENENDARVRVMAWVRPDRIVVTRQDRCGADQAGCYAFQTILHADGRIDIAYLQVPPHPGFTLFDPLAAPWLVGVVPGPGPSRPVVSDQYRAFLAHLDRLYAAVVPFTIAAMLAIILGLPLLFRGFLIRPLDRLLLGIRHFRNGELSTQVAVSFHDEIGYLTESFNEMARNQDAMMKGLEERVAARVAEIAEMTVRHAQLEERNRLSADLHDAVAQTLASASLIAGTLPTQLRGMPPANVKAAELVSQLTHHALSEMRLLLKELRSEQESDRPLADRLTEMVRSFADLHSLDIGWHCIGEASLPTKVQAMLYRVAQEAINNAVKHSGAGRVEVTLESGRDSILLTVSDNGRGFDARGVDRRERLGLAIMRDRSRQIGATLTIDSRPGQGCRIMLAWSRSGDSSPA